MKGMKSWKADVINCVDGSRNDQLTKNRLDFGWASKKMREKPTARPIQRMIKPVINLTSAERGVKLPKAFDRKNLGNASCSMARKQYSF